MDLAIGAGFLAASVLLFSWAYAAFRNENSTFKGIRNSDTIAVGVSVTLTGLIALTLAFFISAGIRFEHTLAEMNALYLGIIAVSAAMCWFLPRHIRGRMRSGNDHPTGSAPDGTVSSFPGASRKSKPGAPQRSSHRKAA